MTTAEVTPLFQVLHANWAKGKLHLWCESTTDWLDNRHAQPGGEHPFAGPPAGDHFAAIADAEPGSITLRLPAFDGRPLPSPPLAHALGHDTSEFETGAELTTFEVKTVTIDPAKVEQVLDAMEELADSHGVLAMGPGVEYFSVAARLARYLLVQQRFVPMLCQDHTGVLTATWSPWLADDATVARVSALVESMPAAARCVDDELADNAWTVTESFLAALIDAGCRRTLIREQMNETVEDLSPADDPQVAWLGGLLDGQTAVAAPAKGRTEMVRSVRRWVGALEDRGESSAWRLCLRLHEPVSDDLPDDMAQVDGSVQWSVSFALQSQENPAVEIAAADIWLFSRDTVVIEGLTLDSPQELLLAELGRASRYYPKLEDALDQQETIELLLSTQDAYKFLREVKPVLIEQGIGVTCPAWWDSPVGRLGAKLRIDSDPAEVLLDTGSGASAASGSQIGLTTLVGYHWEIAIGDTTLSLHDFEKFAQKSSPLVRIGGKWVEIRPEDVASAIRFIGENPGGKMKLAEAMRLAYSSDPKQTGLPILGMEATGWVASLFGAGGDAASVELPLIETPKGFRGTLRPYQQRGLSWLVFMERFGFGACLADDMGLGKTIQLLALLVYEREQAARMRAAGETDVSLTVVAPTLLIVPMSVVGNWLREIKRFAPELVTLLHHGVDRILGDEFVAAAESSDIILTTYALANRDRDLIDRVSWGRMVLDEAQFIKNPVAKQSQAVRSIQVEHRIALTGTPVENRLTELWSIMDFLNPGYLGSGAGFRRKFSVPIERYRDQARAEQLRGLVQPFILRRLKTDPTVVPDLPKKVESKELCHLTNEQASLYESCVKRMLTDVEDSEGIRRRGVVLSALIKLKQVCNHPSQFLKDHDFSGAAPVDPSRSGKCVRLLEMLDEVLAEGDHALIFTQFRQMGHLLASMLRHELGRDILFLHGGTAQGKRQDMIDTFQEATGKYPILLLSLKAGGVGLNLTAANHVFHFDRWWNPAVENQATDRAYRIGQTRTVLVHKFMVRGTLEERIDEMIESKTELAENIIGTGERWLTEFDTDRLRDLLALRSDAIGDEE